MKPVHSVITEYSGTNCLCDGKKTTRIQPRLLPNGFPSLVSGDLAPLLEVGEHLPDPVVGQPVTGQVEGPLDLGLLDRGLPIGADLKLLCYNLFLNYMMFLARATTRTKMFQCDMLCCI